MLSFNTTWPHVLIPSTPTLLPRLLHILAKSHEGSYTPQGNTILLYELTSLHLEIMQDSFHLSMLATTYYTTTVTYFSDSFCLVDQLSTSCILVSFFLKNLLSPSYGILKTKISHLQPSTLPALQCTHHYHARFIYL